MVYAQPRIQVGNKSTSREHPHYGIIKIGQNTWEESCWLEEICCHSDSSGKLSANSYEKKTNNYNNKRGERLITATRKNTDRTRTNRTTKIKNTDRTRTNRTTINRKQKWEEKQSHRRYKRLISNISHEKTWTWLRKRNLSRNWISPDSNTKQRYMD